METIEKIDIKKMKEDIKKMVEEQKSYVNQRRTVRLVGERKMEPWVATMKHAENREKLRVMYAAYGIARGRSFSYVEKHYPEENHPLNQYQRQIDKILDGYKIQIPVESQEEE